MDLQIQQDQMPLPSAADGSDPNLDEIIYAGEIVGQKQADAALRGYELRRLILERIGAKKEAAGWIKRHAATIQECQDKIEHTHLDPWQRLDMEGRIEIAQARLWTCQQNLRQYDLEISVYLAMLKS